MNRLSRAAVLVGTLLAASAEAEAEGTEEIAADRYVAELAAQRVPASDFMGLDHRGIPIVCGVEDELQPRMMAMSATASVPAGTRRWEAIPSVIRPDGIDSFRLEVEPGAPVTGVTVSKPAMSFVDPPLPWPVPLLDDGLGEDQVAGDGIYTAGPFRFDLNAPLSLPERYKDDPASIPGLNLFGAGIVTIEETDAEMTQFLLNPQIGFLDPSILEVAAATLSTNIVATSHLINVRTDYHATQRLLHAPGVNLAVDLTSAVFDVFPDVFDAFVLLSVDKVERVPRLTSSNFVAGVHASAQRNFSGGSSPPFDSSSIWGSEGRLLSVNALDTGDRGIYSGNAVHELSHLWSASIDGSFGVSDGVHFKPRSNVGSLVGGFLWQDNGDGTFAVSCSPREGLNNAYAAPPLDRYFMGLIPGSEVPPTRVYDASLPVWVCPPDSFSEAQIPTTVTIEQIQAVQGPREPGPDFARRFFRVAFIAESHERFLTPVELTFYHRLAEYFTSAVPSEDPAPYVAQNVWVSITRYFEETTWRSSIPSPDLCVVGPDTDLDGVVDACDNCVDLPNPDQTDFDFAIDDDASVPGVQHYGTACDADLDNSGSVSVVDFFAVMQPCFSRTIESMPWCAVADFDGDGIVGGQDFGFFKSRLGTIPGPGVTEP